MMEVMLQVVSKMCLWDQRWEPKEPRLLTSLPSLTKLCYLEIWESEKLALAFDIILVNLARPMNLPLVDPSWLKISSWTSMSSNSRCGTQPAKRGTDHWLKCTTSKCWSSTFTILQTCWSLLLAWFFLIGIQPQLWSCLMWPIHNHSKRVKHGKWHHLNKVDNVY